jgi:hypothetical protein
MEGLSERAYAAHAGLSRGAVQKARKNGRLVLFADGSIHAVASDARRTATTDPDQQMRAQGGAGESGALASGTSGPGDSTSYLKARTALTVYQAQERQLAIQRKKGVLVDRARAETLVFRLARQERDVWGHLAHPRCGIDGSSTGRGDGGRIGHGRDDRDCGPAKGAGSPCPRAARRPGRPPRLPRLIRTR